MGDCSVFDSAGAADQPGGDDRGSVPAVRAVGDRGGARRRRRFRPAGGAAAGGVADAGAARYQREMLRYFAGRDGTSVDTVLSGQLDDVASAHSEELAEHVPGFAAAFAYR
jgi:hypothetical protein